MNNFHWEKKLKFSSIELLTHDLYQISARSLFNLLHNIYSKISILLACINFLKEEISKKKFFLKSIKRKFPRSIISTAWEYITEIFLVIMHQIMYEIITSDIDISLGILYIHALQAGQWQPNRITLYDHKNVFFFSFSFTLLFI
jgi:hypothetical protein